MISNNNDIGNTVNNVINRNTLPHINNINPALLKRAAAELLSQARNANGTLNNTPTEVSLSSPQDDNVTIPNTTTSITLEHDDHHPALLGNEEHPTE